MRLAGRLTAGSAARVLPGGTADSAGEAGSRTGEPSQRPDAHPESGASWRFADTSPDVVFESGLPGDEFGVRDVTRGPDGTSAGPRFLNRRYRFRVDPERLTAPAAQDGPPRLPADAVISAYDTRQDRTGTWDPDTSAVRWEPGARDGWNDEVALAPTPAPGTDRYLVDPADGEFLVESDAQETVWRVSDKDPWEAFTEGFAADDPQALLSVSDLQRNLRSAFVSTTRNPDFRHRNRAFRYEIKAARNSAPTGIDVSATLRRRGLEDRFPWEEEVAFVRGIDAEAVVSVYEYGYDRTGTWDDVRGVVWTDGDTSPEVARVRARLVAEVQGALEKLGWRGDPIDAREFTRLDNTLFGHRVRPVERTRITAIAEFKLSGERPGLRAGAKKKGGKKPQQSGRGTAAEALGQDTGQPVAGSSRQAETPYEAELVTVSAETARAVRAAVGRMRALPEPKRRQVLTVTTGLLERLPHPEDASLDSLVDTVAWMLGAADELQGLLRPHPHVVYGVARRPGLRRLLAWKPVLAEILSEAPSVLDDLAAASPAWHEAQTPRTAEILARRTVVRELEADPALRKGLFSSDHHLLRFWDGRLDVLQQILAMGDAAVARLANTSSEFATAVLGLPNPVDALWRLGSEAGLETSLLNQVLRGRVITADFFREMLGDEKLKAVLRRYPGQLNLVLSSKRILDAVRAKPEVLYILSGSPALTDVLEDMPEIALRLLSDQRRITAAVNNPAVAVALSYNPRHFHTVDDDQLVLELDGTRQPGDAVRPAGVVPGSSAPLSKGQIERATVPELLRHLKELNPAFADDRGLRSRGNLVRLLAGRPPHALRRVLPVHTALLNLPADDTAALAVLLTASRNPLVAAVYSAPDREQDRQLLDALITGSGEHRSLLAESPAYAFAAYFETRILQMMPLEFLANPWAAGAFAHTPKLYSLVKDDFGKELWEALTAGDSALLRLMHRYPVLARELHEGSWRTVMGHVTSAPRLLTLLLDAYGELSPTHWKHFLTGGLFSVLAQRLHAAVGTPGQVPPEAEGDALRSDGDIDAWPGRPTALALIAFPELLREAVARPDFAETWKAEPARFDGLAHAALRAHGARNQDKSTGRAVGDALADLLGAVEDAAGDRLITEEGYELYRKYTQAVDLLLAGLEERVTREKLADSLDSVNIKISGETLDIYATVLRHERLRGAALTNRYLAQGLFWLKGISELMTIRPSLLDQFERSPGMLRQIMRTEGLAQLLAHDDLSFSIFKESVEGRQNFDSVWVGVALKNPWYNAAFDKQSKQLVRSDRRIVGRLAMASPAAARAIAERSETIHTLAKAPGLVEELLAAREDVVRAVTATQGRLDASAARRGLVPLLQRVPALATALGDRPGVAADAAAWQGLVG
ncbi:hypothetical protein AB0A81_40815, partial [Streptomyces flaveolus]|uniref:scabin-related ADP-ribosyltransferase n=1 Tax=Streptomyces flaveolus TaxID=67297 RepID=UPI0033E8B306